MYMTYAYQMFDRLVCFRIVVFMFAPARICKNKGVLFSFLLGMHMCTRN